MFTNSEHSQFEYLHEILSQCYSPDEAHRVFTGLRRAVSDRIEELEVSLSKLDPYQLVDGRRVHDDIAGHKAELVFLDEVVAKIQRHRVYSDKTDAESNQLCQREESLQRTVRKLENISATMGGFPPEAMEEIRRHPDMEILIGRVKTIQEARAKGGIIFTPPPAWHKELQAMLPTPRRPTLVVASAPILGADGKPASTH